MRFHPHLQQVDLEICAENFIVPSERKSTLLYCHLTDSHLAWTPAAVDMHITGRKYIRALWAWREGCGETEVVKTFSPVKGSKNSAALKLNGMPTPVGAKKYVGNALGAIWLDRAHTTRISYFRRAKAPTSKLPRSEPFRRPPN